jgi:hypothetical protein
MTLTPAAFAVSPPAGSGRESLNVDLRGSGRELSQADWIDAPHGEAQGAAGARGIGPVGA